MEIKVTTPTDMDNYVIAEKVKEAINKFEIKFKKEESGRSYYHLVIEGEYDRDVRNEIEDIYLKAGWSTVKCTTSSEKGERGGLTGLILESV